MSALVQAIERLHEQRRERLALEAYQYWTRQIEAQRAQLRGLDSVEYFAGLDRVEFCWKRLELLWLVMTGAEQRTVRIWLKAQGIRYAIHPWTV